MWPTTRAGNQASKQIICMVTVLVVILPARFEQVWAAQSDGSSSGPWVSDLITAQRRAAASGKLILLHFWSSKCQPCRFMNERVLTQPEVAKYLAENFEAVKINVEQLPYTAKQYGVSAVPTCVILSPTGEVLQRWVGATDANRYLQQLAQVRSQWQARAQVATGPPPGAAPAISAPSPSAYPPPGATSPPPSPGMVPAQMPPSFAGVNPGMLDSPSVAAGYSPQQPAGTAPGMAPSPSPPAAIGPSPAQTGGLVAASPPTAGQPIGPQQVVSASPQVPAGWGTAGAGPSGPPQFTASAGIPSSSMVGGPPGSAAAGSSPANLAGSPPSGTLGNSPQAVAQNSSVVQSPSSVGEMGSAMLPVGLDGFCPVTLSDEGRWLPGNPQWGVIHQGRTYYCAGPNERAKFLANPERYAPVFSGYDVVLASQKGILVPGKREHGAWYQGRVYLFASEETLLEFDRNPSRFASYAANSVPSQSADSLRVGIPNPARTSW